MERASHALVDLDYLACERLCLEALVQAREAQRWEYYARILLPLQEARRQRRMIASDGGAMLISTKIQPESTDRTAAPKCLVLTHPNKRSEAKALRDYVRSNRSYVEVLLAHNDPQTTQWTVRSFAGPDVSCQVAAPGPTVTEAPISNDRWLGKAKSAELARPGHSPLDVGWVLHASEALGDAAIAKVNQYPDAPLGTIKRLGALEQMLEVVDDHEKLHQRLAEAAAAIGPVDFSR